MTATTYDDAWREGRALDALAEWLSEPTRGLHVHRPHDSRRHHLVAMRLSDGWVARVVVACTAPGDRAVVLTEKRVEDLIDEDGGRDPVLVVSCLEDDFDPEHFSADRPLMIALRGHRVEVGGASCWRSKPSGTSLREYFQQSSIRGMGQLPCRGCGALIDVEEIRRFGRCMECEALSTPVPDALPDWLGGADKEEERECQ